MQSRGVHDDAADAAVWLEAQAEYDEGGLRGDDDAHRVVDREVAGRLPGLGREQLVDGVQQVLLLAGVEQRPDGKVVGDDDRSVVRHAVAMESHDVRPTAVPGTTRRVS
jgi:hypothetical protein